MSVQFSQPLSAVAWNDVATGVATNSGVLDSHNSPFVSAFGHVSGATTITLMVSRDGSNFYAGSTVVLSGAADFCLNAEIGAEYVCLQSSADVTATAYLSAKG